jgi:20S proteasome subunit alpha 1
MSKSAGYDRHISIFSPEGKLYQVEYAIKAAKSSGLTTVGMRGADSVCVATQKKISDVLVDPEFVTNIYPITPTIGCIITGLAADGRSLVVRARQIASDFQDKNGYECPVHWLSYKVANLGQLYTQHAYMRPYGVTVFFFGMDEEKGAQLYKVDPAGKYYGCRGAAAGPKEEEATTVLERLIKKTDGKSNQFDTVANTIGALQTVVGSDVKARDLDVAVVSLSEKRVKKLTEQEIDDFLTNIAERD